MTEGTYRLDPTKVMSREEVDRVLSDLRRRAKHAEQTHQTLIIFRLTVGAGLRASEIAGLELRDLRLSADRPCINIRKAVAKRSKSRVVPLWWDEGTYNALVEWRRIRVEEHGAQKGDPVVCVLQDRVITQTRINQGGPRRSRLYGRLSRHQIKKKWKSAIRCLGPERQAQLSAHCGRHTFGSYMVRERGLAAVRDAMGHKTLAMTSIYLHTVPEDVAGWGSVWGATDETKEEGAHEGADSAAVP